MIYFRLGLWVFLGQFAVLAGASDVYFEALIREDLEQLNHQLAKHPELVKALDKRGRTGLQVVIQRQFESGLDALLAGGADPNLANKDGENAVHTWAFNWPEKRVLEKLLAKGADLDQKNQAGRTPLYELVEVGYLNRVDLSAIETLLDLGADPNTSDKFGWRPLHRTVYHGLPRVARLLIGKGAKTDATNNKGTKPIQVYPPHSAKVNGNHRQRFLEPLEILIESGESANQKGVFTSSGINLTNEAYDLGRLQLLLKHGAKMKGSDPQGTLSFLHARTEKVAQAMLAAGAQINEADHRGNTRLLETLRRKDSLPMMRFLIDRGADVNHQNHQGEALLHLIAGATRVDANHLEMSTVLLAAGANPDVINKQGETPLALALDKRKARLASLLIKSGAQVEGSGGVSYLSRARSPEAVRMLLAAGAPISGIKGEKVSPLMKALERDAHEVAQILAEAGAEFTEADRIRLQKKRDSVQFVWAIQAYGIGETQLLATWLEEQRQDTNISPQLERAFAKQVGQMPQAMVPFWIKQLAHADPTWRYHALFQLKVFTGDDFGYDPQAKDREKGHQAWQHWYDQLNGDMSLLRAEKDGFLGMRINRREPVIAYLTPGMPAKAAGLQLGDRLLAIDGVPTEGKELEALIHYHLLGAVGSEVRLLIARKGRDDFEVAVVRKRPGN